MFGITKFECTHELIFINSKLTSGVTESNSLDGPAPRFGLNVKFVGPCKTKKLKFEMCYVIFLSLTYQ